MEPLKNMFTTVVVGQTADVIANVVTDFDVELFLNHVFDEQWDVRELKERYQHIAKVLWQMMPEDYAHSVDLLVKIVELLKGKEHHKTYGTFPYMFLPTCIEFYGLDDFEHSVRGLEAITQLVSAEFAVRPFYIEYPDKMLEQTKKWVQHSSEHVRRLASEGCRPALPWGIALKEYKKDPLPLIPILDSLKNDDSLFVRKSVANNLNDISKTHPELIVQIANDWLGDNKDTDWIVKHACRSLLKAGNSQIMKAFGYADANSYALNAFEILPEVEMGESLSFSFSIINNTNKSVKTRVEYVMYFLRKNEQHNSKTFMISDVIIKADEVFNAKKEYSFKPISTRKYYNGLHKIGLVINGIEIEQKSFNLK